MNKVHICLITDDNYIKPTAVAISSAICNKNNDSEYEFFIITKNVTQQNKKLFKKFETENVKIQFIDAKEEIRDVTAYSHVPQTALLKFSLGEIFSDLDKILYFDGDIIVQNDLSEIYNINLGENYAAVVKDMIGDYSKGLSNILGVDAYFNSGVMLLNLDLMRQNNTKENLIKAKLEHNWTHMDQDALNFVFNKKILLLDVKYNATIAAFKEFKYTIEEINKYYKTNYQTISELEENTVFNHFAGCSRTRPWKFYDGTYSDIWTYYYLKSPFKHQELDRKVYNALFYPKIRPLLKNLFSVVNEKGYKVITILGIKFPIKGSGKKEIQ